MRLVLRRIRQDCWVFTGKRIFFYPPLKRLSRPQESRSTTLTSFFQRSDKLTTNFFDAHICVDSAVIKPLCSCEFLFFGLKLNYFS